MTTRLSAPDRQSTESGPSAVYDPDLVTSETAALDYALRKVGSEVFRAQDRFPPFNSPHEGWAVIKEELDELWEHCKANNGRSHEARMEAMQIAAMAVRYMLDIGDIGEQT